MVEIVKYRAEHLLALEPSEEQGRYSDFVTPAVAKSLEGQFSYSMFAGDTVLGCAGLANRWHESWIAWSYLSAHSGPYLRRMTRAIRAHMHRLPAGRIEAATPFDYKAGRRWLELLGFECETPNGMRHYTPDGRVYALYAMVNQP